MDAEQISLCVSVAGLVLGVFGTVFAVYQHNRSRQVTRISCRIRISTVDFHPDLGRAARQKLFVSYDGQRVESLTVIEAIVQNTGTLPVTQKSIEEPISFIFPDTAELLDAEIIEHSANVRITLKRPTVRTVTGSFRSLDRGESFLIQFLLMGAPPWMPNVTARILGLPQGIDTRKEEHHEGGTVLEIVGVAAVLLSLATGIAAPAITSTLTDQKITALEQEHKSLQAELVTLDRYEQLIIKEFVGRGAPK